MLHVCAVKKTLEKMEGGESVEGEAGGRLDDSDDVIGPPLPPGFKVRRY